MHILPLKKIKKNHSDHTSCFNEWRSYLCSKEWFTLRHCGHGMVFIAFEVVIATYNHGTTTTIWAFRFVGVIWLVFLVPRFLLIRLTSSNLCCTRKSTTNHQQKLEIKNWASLDLDSIIKNARSSIPWLNIEVFLIVFTIFVNQRLWKVSK